MAGCCCCCCGCERFPFLLAGTQSSSALTTAAVAGLAAAPEAARNVCSAVVAASKRSLSSFHGAQPWSIGAEVRQPVATCHWQTLELSYRSHYLQPGSQNLSQLVAHMLCHLLH